MNGFTSSTSDLALPAEIIPPTQRIGKRCFVVIFINSSAGSTGKLPRCRTKVRRYDLVSSSHHPINRISKENPMGRAIPASPLGRQRPRAKETSLERNLLASSLLQREFKGSAHMGCFNIIEYSAFARRDGNGKYVRFMV